MRLWSSLDYIMLYEKLQNISTATFWQTRGINSKCSDKVTNNNNQNKQNNKNIFIML